MATLLDDLRKAAKKKAASTKFYSLEKIDATGALYRMIIGERSNGKTYAVLDRILYNYAHGYGKGAIIRRWGEDFKGGNGNQMFTAHVDNNLVRKYTNSKWESVVYKSKAFYLAKFDEDLNKTVLDEEPFCYAFALNDMEHTKSVSYPGVTTILFDEFLTGAYYIPNEFRLFSNTLSTIIRQGDYRPIIYLCANTVSKVSPYFTGFGIKHVDHIKQGTIQLYQYGDSGCTLALEYCENLASKGGSKASDVYFAFDNPSLKMITEGAWEMEIYPHCPVKFVPKDIRYTFFIVFEENIYQCEIIKKDRLEFLYIHDKTTPLQNEDKDLIYCTEYDPRSNWTRNLLRPRNPRESVILSYFQHDNVYYQDNEVGDMIENYRKWCTQN